MDILQGSQAASWFGSRAHCQKASVDADFGRTLVESVACSPLSVAQAPSTVCACDFRTKQGVHRVPVRVGDRVRLNGQKSDQHAISPLGGIVRYVGTTCFADGIWLGVEFDCAVGCNDGTCMGIPYFSCRPSHGLFLHPSAVVNVSQTHTRSLGVRTRLRSLLQSEWLALEEAENTACSAEAAAAKRESELKALRKLSLEALRRVLDDAVLTGQLVIELDAAHKESEEKPPPLHDLIEAELRNIALLSTQLETNVCKMSVPEPTTELPPSRREILVKLCNLLKMEVNHHLKRSEWAAALGSCLEYSTFIGTAILKCTREAIDRILDQSSKSFGGDEVLTLGMHRALAICRNTRCPRSDALDNALHALEKESTQDNHSSQTSYQSLCQAHLTSEVLRQSEGMEVAIELGRALIHRDVEALEESLRRIGLVKGDHGRLVVEDPPPGSLVARWNRRCQQVEQLHPGTVVTAVGTKRGDLVQRLTELVPHGENSERVKVILSFARPYTDEEASTKVSEMLSASNTLDPVVCGCALKRLLAQNPQIRKVVCVVQHNEGNQNKCTPSPCVRALGIALTNNSTVEELRVTVTSTADWTELGQTIANNAHLKDLLLSCGSGFESISNDEPCILDVMGRALAVNATLRTLQLTGYDIRRMAELGNALRCNSSLLELDLCNNRIRHVEELGKALAYSSNLKSLDLSSNLITEVDELAGGLQLNSSLAVLHLQENRIADILQLSEALNVNTALQVLWLHHNPALPPANKERMCQVWKKTNRQDSALRL